MCDRERLALNYAKLKRSLSQRAWFGVTAAALLRFIVSLSKFSGGETEWHTHASLFSLVYGNGNEIWLLLVIKRKKKNRKGASGK